MTTEQKLCHEVRVVRTDYDFPTPLRFFFTAASGAEEFRELMARQQEVVSATIHFTRLTFDANKAMWEPSALVAWPRDCWAK